MPAVSKVAAAELLITVVLLGCGCESKPKARALNDEPVYQSDEGFSFLRPEGWLMSASGNVPPGPLEKERLLVQYRRTSGEDLATFEVSVMDLPEDTDMVKYLSTASFSAREWKHTGRPESMEAGGAQGTRYHFNAPVKGGQLTKEVTVFRRGGRVYFFTVLFSPKDAGAAEQVRRALGSLVWKKK